MKILYLLWIFLLLPSPHHNDAERVIIRSVHLFISQNQKEQIMAHVNDVAQYIVKSHNTEISTVKLQKLVYYAQAWNLVWEKKPLFHQRIEAWINGPVIPELFKQHRGHFTVNKEMCIGNSYTLTDDEKETIDVVFRAYGHLNGQQLSDISHCERPWHKTYDAAHNGVSATKEISHTLIYDFYKNL